MKYQNITHISVSTYYMQEILKRLFLTQRSLGKAFNPIFAAFDSIDLFKNDFYS